MSLTDRDIEQILLEMGAASLENKVGSKGQTLSSGKVSSGSGKAYGLYTDIKTAVAVAGEAQKMFHALSLEIRAEVIHAMRKAALENAEHLARLAHEETGYGHVAHKTLKNQLAANKTPGLEDLNPKAFTGDNGLTLMENAPYGVIGSITPSTNPTATIINNSISMVTGGNAVVYNCHPGAKRASNEAVVILNRAIKEVCGVENLLCSIIDPTAQTGKDLMEHPEIRMLAVTGGEAVVAIAMRSGKKVIAAGPGNPPVIVDDTANVAQAAKDITRGASFDNNVLCIAEKEVFVMKTVEDQLVKGMIAAGCYLAEGSDIQKICDTVLTKGEHGFAPQRDCVGKSATHILEKSGVNYTGNPCLIILRAKADHPLVSTEMLMPVVPIVGVDTFEEAVDLAVKAENNYLHTAIMHSKNVDRLTHAARALNTTIFVKNGPSFAGLGFEGEGYTTLTISTPTGEGLTSAKDFVRSRRCTLAGAFHIL